MIGRETEAVLNRAVRYALEHEHEYFTLEHVFLSLLENAQVWDAIVACGGNPLKMKEKLEEYLLKEIPKISKNSEEEMPIEHPVATLSIQRLIQRALFHVQSTGKKEVDPQDLLIALFYAKDSKAHLVLTDQGVDRLDVLNYLSHGMHKGEAQASENNSESGAQREPVMDTTKQFRFRSSTKSCEEALGWYALNLNEKALEGKLDPLFGREKELKRITQVLCRRRKNNPLLVGEAGVGKTALAEGLALKIVQNKVPALLAQSVVFSLDLGSLLAGAKFRGDFEQRFKRLIQGLEVKKEKGQEPILFIDEIHTIIGAGAVNGGALDVANLLKPLLTRSSIRFMGSTTEQEFRNIFEKDRALTRRFQKIEIHEPTVEETVQIIEGLKSQLEPYHQVHYTAQAIRAAVELSTQHLTERFLPDKAIDVLDEVGARSQLMKCESHSTEQAVVVDVAEVEEVVAQMACIPTRSVSVDQKHKLKNLRQELKFLIFGQDEAIHAVVDCIQLARSGLQSNEKPVGSFLFCGSTGVGKTELSKQLASCLGIPFLRYDMSEYSKEYSLSRLIGTAPGYIGFEQAGSLTSKVLSNPHSVVLLDEFEKAHPVVRNIFLQVMDYGFLTDQNGRKIDFRNVILIMTSNAGSRELEQRPLGIIGDLSVAEARAIQEVERTFSPEFRNRLDAIIYFNALNQKMIEEVVQSQLMKLESKLSPNIELEVEKPVKEWLGQKGYDRRMGARPLEKLIQKVIKKPLSQQILFGKLQQGGKVMIKLENNEIKFDFLEK